MVGSSSSKQLGIVHQRLRELDALLHARRVAVDALIALVAEPDELEHHVRALHRLRRRQPRQLGGVAAQLDRGHADEVAIALRHVADARADLRRLRADVMAEHGRAALERQEAEQHFISVDLPAPFGPSRPTVPDGTDRRQPAQRVMRAVALVHVAEFEERVGGHRRLVRAECHNLRPTVAELVHGCKTSRRTGTTPASSISSCLAAA